MQGTPTATANTTTIFTVGTTAAVAYSAMKYASTQATGTFGATALPNTSGATGTSDAWRSGLITASIPAGTWTVAMSVISTVAATGTGNFNVRVWKSTSPVGASATEITSGAVSSSSAANLTTGAAQNLTATFNPGAVSLSAQYIFVQMAWKITVASGSTTANVVIRTDATNSVLTVPAMTFTGTAESITDTVATYVKPNGAIILAPDLYVMRGINTLSTYVYWTSFGIDGLATQFLGGNTPLTQVVVIRKLT